MEVNGPKSQTVQRIVLIALIACLALLAAALGAMLFLMLRQAGQTHDAEQRYFVRMAWLCLFMLCLTLLLAFWLLMRLFATWVPSGGHPPTPYVDAWAEAGRRMKAPADADESGAGGDDDEEGPDGGQDSGPDADDQKWSRG